MRGFPQEYAAQLADVYDQQIAGQLTDPGNVQHAYLREQQGTSVPFVVVDPPEPVEGQKPLLYVPGFGEGIVNKASFAAELASQGRTVILPGASRAATIKDDRGRPSSLLTQALDILAVLEEAAGDEPADIVPHSYGSLVFDAMVRVAPERFKDSNVIMLAPGGSIEGQTLTGLGAQWLRFMKSEADQGRPMEFPDKKNATGMASARVLMTNIRRTVLEVGDLWRREVDYGRIARAVEFLAVLTYIEDEMFPDHLVGPKLSKEVRAGHIAWAMPAAVKKVLSGELSYAGEGSVHDDEQYNPSRVAGAVLAFLD